MIEKAFLNTDRVHYTSYIFTEITLSNYEIKITDCEDEIRLHSTGNDENDLYKLNTLIEHITNLRDRFLFLKENKKKIDNRYKTKEEAQQFLDYLKEKDNLLFERYAVKTSRSKKGTYYYIGLK